MPELFEEQVERTPEATAVVYEDQQLSYRELNKRANQLAHLLIAEGIGPEDVVALAVPRSMEMIVSLLGILKAGAAYLPLDPEYPKERLEFMLEDAQPACIVTTSESVAALCRISPRIIVDDPETLAAIARHPPVTQATATVLTP